MNNNLKKLIDTVPTDISGKWVSINSLEQFANTILDECIRLCEFGEKTQTSSTGAATMIKSVYK